MRFFIAFTLSLSSCSYAESAQDSATLAAATGVLTLFEASTGCQANPLGNFWHCASQEITISAAQVSETPEPLLEALGALNTLTYSFKCVSSAPLSLRGKSLSLAPLSRRKTADTGCLRRNWPRCAPWRLS